MTTSQYIFFSKFPRTSTPLVALGLICIVVFLLFNLSGNISLEHYPHIVFILIFLSSVVKQRWILLKDTGVRLIAIGLLLPFILFWINYLDKTAQSFEYFTAEKLVRLTGFVVAGFWLGGSLRNIQVFLVLAFLGLMIALFNVDIIPAFKSIFTGSRVDFALRNAQHTSMFFGVAVIALITFHQNIRFNTLSKTNKWLFTALWGVGLSLALIVLIGTQTRASLLAFTVIFILSVILMSIKFYREGITDKTKKLFITYILLSTMVLSFAINLTLSNRGHEAKVIKQLANAELNNLPRSSLGLRLDTWIEASEWIAQKPLQGWGSQAAKHILQEASLFEDINIVFGHFHNSYIEFAVSYGLTGLSFLLFIFIWLNRRIYLICKRKPELIAVWYYTFYGSLFMAVINVFESFVFWGSGTYTMAILLAPAYTIHLSELYAEYQSSHNRGAVLTEGFDEFDINVTTA